MFAGVERNVAKAPKAEHCTANVPFSVSQSMMVSLAAENQLADLRVKCSTAASSMIPPRVRYTIHLLLFVTNTEHVLLNPPWKANSSAPP